MSSMSNDTIIVAGGGTGGHLYPGLALAEKLKQITEDKLSIVFIGSLEGLESQIVPKFNFELKTLPVGRGSPLSLKSPLNLPKFAISLFRCMKIFNANRPKAVISLGGFAAFVPGLVATFYKVPLFLLEQNSIPGRVTKALSPFAKKIFLQFQSAEKFLRSQRDKLSFDGSPLLEKMEKLTDTEYGIDRDTLLIIGGSQGATRLNQIMVEIYPILSKAKIKTMHLSGSRDYEWVAKEAEGFANIAVLEYSDVLEEVYPKTRLAIARAGASTINEFQVAGIPAVFIPFPAAKDNHQKINAEDILGSESQYIDIEEKIYPEVFAEKVISLFRNYNELKELSDKMKAQSKSNASLEIAKKIVDSLD